MSRYTQKWINALISSGLSVVDHRGRLPTRRDWPRRDVADLRGVCWHHSAGSRTTVDALLPIARYHIGALGPVHLTRDGSGAPGIAYTFAVVGSGTVYVLNDLEAYTWSQKGANKTHIGGLVLGSFHATANTYGTTPTRGQMFSVRKVSNVTREFLRTSDRLWVAVHSDFRDTVCPGDSIRSLVVHSMRGEKRPWGNIRTRQQALADVGVGIHVDGVWGPHSRIALEGFQREHGLTVDGMWGPKTESAMVVAVESLDRPVLTEIRRDGRVVRHH